MMRILVDALPLRRGGGVTYLNHQSAALARVAPGLSMHYLVSPWAGATLKEGLVGEVEVVPVRSVRARFMYEQLQLPRRSRAWDLLYCPANFGPFLTKPTPTVLVQQNTIYYGSGLTAPETRLSRPIGKVKANHLAIRRADAVVAISDSLAQELRRTVPGVEGKMTTIKSGAECWTGPSIPIAGLPERFVVSVANGAAHKRLEDVVQGWAMALAETGQDVSLVLVGQITDDASAKHRLIAGSHVDLLVHLGPVENRCQIKWIYEHAFAMVSMSVAEAFPLTIIEARSLGCPVVLSDIPAHREVSMGRADFVRPRDPAALSDALVERMSSQRSGCEPCDWPVTWDDNARMLVDLFARTAR